MELNGLVVVLPLPEVQASALTAGDEPEEAGEMVYAAVPAALVVYPVSTAIACRVSEALTVSGPP
jgi:hypothetical protein